MSYNITGTTITLTRGDTFEALVSATKRDGTQYIPVEGDSIRFAMKENYDDPRISVSMSTTFSSRKQTAKLIPLFRKQLLSFRKRLTEHGWSMRNRVY